jgi:hypothetical protein
LDALAEVVDNRDQPPSLLRVNSQHRTTDARVLVLAGRSVGASAGAQFELALVEVLLELAPLLLGRFTVFLGRPFRPTLSRNAL